MLRALGIDIKDRGKVALEKYYDEEFGARVSLTEGKDKNEAGETIYFHDLNSILPSAQYEDLFDEDEPEEEEDEDVEEEEVEDTDEEVDDEVEDEEGITIEDLDDMTLAELKELAEEWDVSTKPDKGKKKLGVAQMRRRLAEVIDGADDEEEEEDEEDDDESLTEEDLAELNLAELRDVADENDVKLPKPKPGKKLSAARVRKILAEALFSGEDEDGDEEPF